jgi:ribulose-5-phosphate 4-epimerase/fuculose-1-phosphate aldolase
MENAPVSEQLSTTMTREDEAAISDKALIAWRFLYRRGFIEGFGHISARLPGSDRFLLTRHSLGPRATAADLICMDLDGRKLSGGGDLPGEYPIHLEIYRARPDVGSVIHYHGLYATAFTTSPLALRPIHVLASIFRDGLPVYGDPRLVSDRRRGELLARALGSSRVALMRAHGVVATGAGVEEAVAAAFLLEENAHRACVSAALGGPVWLDEETIAAAGDELLRSRGPFRRVWAMVESEAD